MDSDDSIKTEGLISKHTILRSIIVQIQCCVIDLLWRTGSEVGNTLQMISLHLECNMLTTSDRYQRTCEALQAFEPSAVSDDPDMIRRFLSLRSEYYKEFYRSVSKSGGQDLLVLLPDYRAPGQPLGLEWSRFHREFEDVSLLASGGFGKVFRARNKLDDTVYAVKTVKIDCKNLKQVPEKLAEVKMLARLQHNNVVSLKTAWLETGTSSNRTNGSSAIRQEEEEEAEEEEEEEEEEQRGITRIRFKFPCLSSFSIVFFSRLPPRPHPHPLLHFLRIQNNKLSDREEFRIRSGGDGEEKEDDDDDDSVVFKGSSGGPAVSAGDENRNQVVKRENPPRGVIVDAKPHLTLEWAMLYIQMPLCRLTLREWLDKRNASKDFNQFYVKFQQKGPVQHVDVVLDVLQQLLNGLNYIHARGIVHHDIKPSNIFVSRSDHDSAITIQLGDFGLARSRGSSLAGVGFGTPFYAAPEQLEGMGKSDPKSDIFALGIVLLELLVPFPIGMERADMINQVYRGPYPPDLNPDFMALAKGMLQEQPYCRPEMAYIVEEVKRMQSYRDNLIAGQQQSLSLGESEKRKKQKGIDMSF